MLFLVTTSEGLGGINVENIDVRRKQTNVFMMSLKYYSINECHQITQLRRCSAVVQRVELD